MICLLFGYAPIVFFLFLVGENSISIVFGLSFRSFSFTKFKPAYTRTSPSSYICSSWLSSSLGSLWTEKYWLGFILIFWALWGSIGLLISIWLFSISYVKICFSALVNQKLSLKLAISICLIGLFSISAFSFDSYFYSYDKCSSYFLLVYSRFINVSDSGTRGFALGIFEGENVFFLVGEAPI